ncbi:Receptor-type tyrosine-protein phosphatase U [Acipenser ruthenus]|uniref:Receptor-type tyrosine-protein phosphatase U n=1 Tax=Acipenser ruthenus TaxID=7906 RepID=A0A662YQC7_ACIRT|nr:Receptor-type tyrosine-protein phosphatase U [Acipenser ruthenus]
MTLAKSAHSIEKKGGCTFDEGSDPSLCEYSQGEEDDFDWQLVKTYPAPHSTSDLLPERYFIGSSVSEPMRFTLIPLVLASGCKSPLGSH